MELSPLNKLIPSWGSPTLEGFDTSNIQDGQRLGGISNRQFVQFYNHKFLEVYAKEVHINERTGESRVIKWDKREVEKEKVKIINPGDKNVIDAYAQDFHRRDFWQQYKNFRDGKNVIMGTPIDECSFVSSHIATELRYLGCYSLEQLADASDLLCDRIPNGYELREYAKALVQAGKDNKDLAQVNALKNELEKSQGMIAQMQAEMETLKKFIVIPTQPAPQPIVEAPKNKGGRPKKIVETKENAETA